MVTVHPLNQGDLAWHNTFVGNSATKTCGAVGCVVTSMTMAANTLLGPFPGINRNLIPPDLRPGHVAGLTSAHYNPGSAALLMESAATTLRLRISDKERLRQVQRDIAGINKMTSLVNTTLAKGGLAILRIDYDLKTPEDNHTIVCFGYDGGYKCADPAGGVLITLDPELFIQRTSTRAYFTTGVAPIFLAS